MNDNMSAFRADDYDEKIKQTLPYYDEFYEQVIDLVKILKDNAVTWLDIGCGTGKMGSVAFENIELMRNCGFKAVEILWLSNMQVGLWGIK